jgi:hypothetical protein
VDDPAWEVGRNYQLFRAMLAGSTVLAGNDLAGEFVNPPKEAQPWVYY